MFGVLKIYLKKMTQQYVISLYFCLYQETKECFHKSPSSLSYITVASGKAQLMTLGKH